MELQKITKELTKNGFVAYLRKVKKLDDEFIVAGIPDNETNIKIGTSFTLRLEEDSISLILYNGQTPEKQIFKDVKTLIKKLDTLFK